MLDDDAAVSHPADTVLVSLPTHRSLKRDFSHSGFVSSSAARVTGPGGATVGQAPALHLIQGQDHACGNGPATPHIEELQRVANGSHSALPSRWAPSVRAASADAPKPGGLLRSRRPPGGYRHRSGAAPMAWGGWFAHPEPAPQSRPGWTTGKGAPHPVRGAVGGLTKLAGSPGQKAPRFSLHANILRGTLAVLKTRICSPVDRVTEED